MIKCVMHNIKVPTSKVRGQNHQNFVKKNIFIPLYHIMNVVYALGRGLSNVFVTCVQSLYVLV